jgi:hypothetical protein
MVTILENNSNEDFYIFVIRIEKATYKPSQEIFEISASKDNSVGYPGMMYFAKKEKLGYEYTWHRLSNTV